MTRKSMTLALPAVLVTIAVSCFSCVKEQGSLPVAVSLALCDSLNVKYSTEIQPMMQANCATIGCHDGSGAAPLDLNTYADLKTFASNGQLKARVINLKDMPPSAPLPDSLIQKLNCWIDAGALNN